MAQGEVRRTTCNRDCPDACSILATVEGDRVVKIAGDPNHPITKGFLCYRTNHFLSTQYSSERLQEPLIRKGDSFHPISWDEALDLAAERLLSIRKESGPLSIFHYRSGGSLGLLKIISSAFFEKFGPVTGKRGDICSGAGDAAQMLDFGEEESHDFFDLRNSKNLVLWGKNPVVSGPHLVPLLRELRHNGTKIVLIDPVAHKSRSLCDRYIQLRPGGDFALAMAVAQILFAKGLVDKEAANYCDHLDAFAHLCQTRSVSAWCQEADVPKEVAADLALLFADRPTAILVGWGMGRRTNGGAIVRALDALGAISGNLGIPGGGVSFYFKRRGAFDTSFVTGEAPRTLCEPTLGKDLLETRDPPIRAMWVTAGNPVAMLPDSQRIVQGLQGLDFLVVVDSFLTDTARYAHLVLPTTTLLEADDILGAYGHHYLGVARPVVPPPPRVRSDLEIIQGLASRVGLGQDEDLCGSAEDIKRRLIAPKLGPHGVTLEAIEAGYVRNPLPAKVLFADRKFPTPSGRVNLITEPGPALPGPDPDYPLQLMALSTERSQSAQWVQPLDGPIRAKVHPEAACGLADGEIGILESRIGQMQVRIVLDPDQRKDVIVLPKGGHLRSGHCANALVTARVSDLGECGVLYEEAVRLRQQAR